MKTPAEICESISLDLKARKITHKELAEMIGKSKAVVSTQISGKKSFSKEMAALFCQALGYNINFLLYGEGSLRDDSFVRDIVKIPAADNFIVDTSVLAGLIQIAEDLLLMNGDENALEAWREINKGNYIGYKTRIESLVKEKGTALSGSPILARYVSEHIKSELYLPIRPTENE